MSDAPIGMNPWTGGPLGDRDRKYIKRVRALEAEIARLREALEGMRRSDGQGGFLNCWCDSEYGHLRVRPHAPYCITARRALEADDG